jgi:NAD(P)-dependent dehydrogenase (short-subunit alcohol dehydrogenase family)
MQILENRVAIVTGGTGALGRAVVENFLMAGAKAAVPYVVDAEVPLLQKRLGNRFPASEIFLKRSDVTDEAQTAKFVTDVASKWDKIDILVNLVGGFWGGKPITETTLAEWQAMFDLNVKPTFLCCRAVVPIMQRNKWDVSCRSRRAAVCKGPATTQLTLSRRARSRLSPRRLRRRCSTTA